MTEIEKTIEGLERHGATASGGVVWGMRCPWHGEETPSLSIWKNTESYHCYGCGKTGSAVELLARLEASIGVLHP